MKEHNYIEKYFEHYSDVIDFIDTLPVSSRAKLSILYHAIDYYHINGEREYQVSTLIVKP